MAAVFHNHRAFESSYPCGSLHFPEVHVCIFVNLCSGIVALLIEMNSLSSVAGARRSTIQQYLLQVHKDLFSAFTLPFYLSLCILFYFENLSLHNAFMYK